MTVTPSALPAATELVPPATDSIHGRLLQKNTPQWLLNATPQRRAALKDSEAALPAIYLNATPAQRKTLHDCFTAAFTAQTALDKTMADLHDVDTFAEPLLLKALKDQYGLVLDVRKTWVCLKKATTIGIFKIELKTFEVMKLSLLAAAQHNFEASEAEEDAFHSSSGFLLQGATADTFEPTRVNLTIHQFLTLCRSLDIGAQYQTYLKTFIKPTDTAKATTLREQFIASKKTAMRAAAEQALIQKDIDADDHAMVLSVIDGETFPQLKGKPVWFCELGLMKRRMNGCVVFVPAQKYRYPESCIVYVPHDSDHPLKHFTFAEMEAHFKALFTAADSPAPTVAGPTHYQKFFSQFVPYADHPYYFGQFTKDASGATWAQTFAPIVPVVSEVVDAISMFPLFKITNPAPPPKLPQAPEQDPYLDVTPLRQKGQGLWGDNLELWTYLYERSQAQSIADAAAHAVPTADVDARVRAQKIAFWLNTGMFALTFVTAFVPVLGEITLAFMAGQLLQEGFEGAIDWSEGDRKAAKAHMIGLAENLLLLAAMHGAGKGLGKLAAVKAAPVIEEQLPVTLPNGQTRLWKPDLTPYKSDRVLPPEVRPNSLGQYVIDGKTWIRLGNDVYEKTYDPALKKWRIRHPTDSEAYQPILEHNQHGAWRHSHERPLTWDRLTLLRRLGHSTESFSDEQLRVIGEVSGVPDEVLRKVHMDATPMPAVLADTLEQFKVDQEVDEVIAQIRLGAGSDSRFECVAPLAVELPRWPHGRVLEVFEGPEIWGKSQRYGQPSAPSDVRASIKITRSDVRAGKLAELILNDLNAEETTQLLGTESAWNGHTAQQVFNERLASHALIRRKALFDSLMKSRKQPATDPGPLGRSFPGLSRRATDELLRTSSAPDRIQLQETGKVARQLGEQARVSLQQARLNRAIAGMHRDTLANLDGDRLALHTLEKLPGWPAGLRLEVRVDSVQGQLLDSIGAKEAPVTKYLVKDGDSFQACDERGEPLHSVSPYSRNFFQSIMHALPDNAREGLGIPSTSQDELLQRTLADYARRHRSEMARILKQRVPRSRPSLRLPGGRLGYPLSGRGAGRVDIQPLIARVRDIYPNVSEGTAERFVLRRLSNGDSRQHIFTLLNNRQREGLALQEVLDRWAGSDFQRPAIASHIMSVWREGLFRSEVMPSSALHLDGVEALPEWHADFSHVRELSVDAQRLLGDAGTAFLERFPQVQRLNVRAEVSNMSALVERLASLPTITELTINSRAIRFSSVPSVNYSPAVLESIAGMTHLQDLRLEGDVGSLDVSRLAGLRNLYIAGSMDSWPTGIMDLAQLESVNLANTQINALPEAMFTGHVGLWDRLHMDWVRFDTRAFRRAYDHVRIHHPMHDAAMARNYVNGALRQLTGNDGQRIFRIERAFEAQLYSATDRIERVIPLVDEYQALSRDLEQWRTQVGSVERGRIDPASRERAARRLRACWHEGTEQRLVPGAGQESPSTLLPRRVRLELNEALGDLPTLPEAGFSHVTDLELRGVRVPIEGISAFLQRFTTLESLSLASNNLVDLPAALERMQSLRELDLSYNTLRVTPSIQARLNELPGLFSLQLQFNPIDRLDTGRLTRLLRLDLSHTAIVDWPAGVLELLPPMRLDLSHSAVTTIPEAALQGHDDLLLNTSLRGCRLTEATLDQVRGFAQRVYAENPLGIPTNQMTTVGEQRYRANPLGIPAAELTRGQTGGVPEFFPEEAARNPDLLLPVPGTADDQAGLTLLERLQCLDRGLDAARATELHDAFVGSGLDATAVESRLAEWENQHRQWIQVLNEWIGAISTRLGGDWIRPLARRQAADRLLASWHRALHVGPSTAQAAGSQLLDFGGLRLGDLPTPPTLMTHVGQLDLTSVWITDQGSNGFLRAFSHVDSLTLENNGLRVLPDAVGEFRGLRHLNATGNDLRDAQALQLQLANMPMLQTLNLGTNTLFEFDISGMARLEDLNLHRNMLAEWPTGVLDAPRLLRLDLSGNQIETIAPEAFAFHHQALMLNTDLTDNLLLEEEFEDLLVYRRRTGIGLGFTEQEIVRLIEGYQPDEATSESDVTDGEEAAGPPHDPDIETPEAQKDRWFTDEPQDSDRHRTWDELHADRRSRSVFYTLSQLRYTDDFRTDPAGLTRRVWVLLDALYNDATLRDEVFAHSTAAEPRRTCGDGRILLFNDLETMVRIRPLTHDANPQALGLALFRLARGTMRLDALERLARSRPGDAAEVRLAYRIDLSQRLDLPPQPHGMMYRNMARVSPADLDTAYQQVIAGESDAVLVDALVDDYRYWGDYLRARYPDEFATLAARVEQRSGEIEDQYSLDDPEYNRLYTELNQERRTEERALMVRLTVQERRRLGV